MNPIYEHKPNGGIGYGFEEFLNHFFEICYEHLRDGRARAFAFILFDFEHGDVFKTMKDRSVFTKLDRISGKDLTIFYLNSNDTYLINNFNQIFGYALGGYEEIQRPAIVFFKVVSNDAEDIKYHQISNNKLFAFQEINDSVKDYITRLNKKTSKHPDFLKDIFKRIGEAGFDYIVERFFDKLTRG